MNVRTLIQALLNVEMDDAVGVIVGKKFYPVRLVAHRNDPKLYLGIAGSPPFDGRLDVITFKANTDAIVDRLAELAKPGPPPRRKPPSSPPVGKGRKRR
jgi:hypothetical protein